MSREWKVYEMGIIMSLLNRIVAAWTWCEIALMVRWDWAEHHLWLPHGAGGVLPEASLSQAVQC